MSDAQLVEKHSEEVTSLSIEANWSATEFAGLDLGDRRLDRRVVKICADFAAQPQAQIPQASEDWASTKAAYRFFENPKVSVARLLAPHQPADPCPHGGPGVSPCRPGYLLSQLYVASEYARTRAHWCGARWGRGAC